jgi:hypothetical protein
MSIKFISFKSLKVHYYMFRPIWLSSGVLFVAVAAYVVKKGGPLNAHMCLSWWERFTGPPYLSTEDNRFLAKKILTSGRNL